MKKVHKRLQLNRNTIRILSAQYLTQAIGGGQSAAVICTTSTEISCHGDTNSQTEPGCTQITTNPDFSFICQPR